MIINGKLFIIDVDKFINLKKKKVFFFFFFFFFFLILIKVMYKTLSKNIKINYL